jgi:hypothetical protein
MTSEIRLVDTWVAMLARDYYFHLYEITHHMLFP